MRTDDKTRKVLDFILSCDHPPTVREIQKALNISSTSVVYYHLKILEKEGQIKMHKRKARGVIPTQQKGIPIRGFIYADRPLPGPDSEILGFISVSTLKPSSKIYALWVKGDSMVDAGIHDGDLVVLEGTNEVKNGDMVAVWIRGRDVTTLKRFFRDEKGVTLKPESPFFKEPIRIEGEELENLEIKGKVIMVIRDLSHEGNP